jgi:hypothetical protein
MKNQTKNVLVIIVILLIVVAIIWISKSRKAMAPVEEPVLDTTASINQDLSQINVDNTEVDNNLKSLDTDLNTL